MATTSWSQLLRYWARSGLLIKSLNKVFGESGNPALSDWVATLKTADTQGLLSTGVALGLTYNDSSDKLVEKIYDFGVQVTKIQNKSLEMQQLLRIYLNDNFYIAGSSEDDLLEGGPGNDLLEGDPKQTSSNDRLKGNQGNDLLDGGGGINTAVYTGNYSNYAITQIDRNKFKIEDLRFGKPDGIDIIENIVLLEFIDETKVFDPISNSWKTYSEGMTVNGFADPKYAIQSSTDIVSEGEIISFYIDSTDVPQGTSVYWEISGSGVSGKDFTSGKTSGKATINSAGRSIINLEVANDYTSEINEMPILRLYSDSKLSNLVAASQFQIRDTSKNLTPSVEALADVISCNEGESFVVSGKTTNIRSGSALYYTISGTGINDNDIKSKKLNDVVYIDQSGLFQLPIDIANDNLTEGSEELLLNFSLDLLGNQKLGETIRILINDTSNQILTADSSIFLEKNQIKAVLTGTADSKAIGNDISNELIGNQGNNILDGGKGADSMQGGGGDDTYIVDDSSDMVIEYPNQGTDTIISTVSYTLPDNVELLRLTGKLDLQGNGNNQDNYIRGNSGANRLDGRSGQDVLEGSLGDDVYCVDDIGDIVIERWNEGYDIVDAVVSFILSPNTEELRLLGDKNIDGTGNELSNQLRGNDADNLLTGLDGNDIIDGMGGGDIMIGGRGDDIYSVENIRDQVIELKDEGNDTVLSGISYTLG